MKRSGYRKYDGRPGQHAGAVQHAAGSAAGGLHTATGTDGPFLHNPR